MLRSYKADLHVHTCLSPCADLKMSPLRIAEEAKRKEIEIIGICDHNTAENTPALLKLTEGSKILVLPGIEVTTQEEVHLLALFGNIEQAFILQNYIYQNLPGENDEESFGLQVVVNEKDEVLGFNKKLLIGATTLPLKEILKFIHSIDGLAVASHIDKENFSIISQLGFIPENIELDGLEVSALANYKEFIDKYPSFPIIRSSDAHFLEEIGRFSTKFIIKEKNFEEIKQAFQNKKGRKIII